MTTFDTRLLPPDDDDVEIPVYAPVWRPLVWQLLLLAGGALVINFAAGGIQLSADQRVAFSALFALVPVRLWLVFALRAEGRVQQPRQRLIAVFFVSMLVANAAAAPIIEIFIEPGEWLNSIAGLSRIFNYTLTVGLVTEFLKYLVLRYMTWPAQFRVRTDCVAYGVVVSLGFATVFNLRYALLEGGGQPGPAAIRIASVVLMQQGIGLVMSYGLMQLKQERGGLLALPLMLLLAAFLHGVYIALRAGFVVQGFGIGATANSPLLGMIFSAVFGGILYGVYAFLISSADARDVRMAGLGQ
jgi:RsiW-degrading membrane proteinase PrsW (M82 family)